MNYNQLPNQLSVPNPACNNLLSNCYDHVAFGVLVQNQIITCLLECLASDIATCSFPNNQPSNYEKHLKLIVYGYQTSDMEIERQRLLYPEL